jgi:hypothetical protein
MHAAPLPSGGRASSDFFERADVSASLQQQHDPPTGIRSEGVAEFNALARCIFAGSFITVSHPVP